MPPLGPALDSLSRAGVESAYASLQFAGRLSLESDERILASQAWNERIPGDPLRFRDEVDLDPRAAWVLSPHLSRGMPRAGGFRECLREMGGSFREDVAGDLVVFRSFRPPYDEARPVPRDAFEVREFGSGPLPAAALDRDPFHGLDLRDRPAPRRRPRGESRRSAVPSMPSCCWSTSRPLPSPFRGWPRSTASPSSRGPARHGLQWVNGAPRAARQALLAVVLGGETATEVRLIFQGPGPPLRRPRGLPVRPGRGGATPCGPGACRPGLPGRALGSIGPRPQLSTSERSAPSPSGPRTTRPSSEPAGGRPSGSGWTSRA